jgi:hypothetical protein
VREFAAVLSNYASICGFATLAKLGPDWHMRNTEAAKRQP